jgi:gamma-glutamylcysteine synthetase
LLLQPDITKGSNLKYGNTIIKTDISESETEEIKPVKRFIDVYQDVLDYVDRDVETLVRLL